MKQTGYDMIYLSACAVNGIKPDSEYISNVDLGKLFQVCQYHSMSAIVCTALESAGIRDGRFIEARAKAIRKNMLLDTERGQICGFLESNDIWYMPLKGVILKDMYPKIGMRQMSDNDILFDGNYRKQVLEYMKQRGYAVKDFNVWHHDTYMKPPVYNFEMHVSLFGTEDDPEMYGYYLDVKDRLVKDDSSHNLYHFTDEDFYIFMVAHEYKHYSKGGTGLRSLLDCFVYLNKKGKFLDWKYITRQSDMLGISEFERNSRRLSMKIFESPDCRKLSVAEKEMLEYYLSSGTYGTHSNVIKGRIRKMNVKSRKSYIIKRLFPDIGFYREKYPVTAKCPFLIPFAWCHRIFRALTVRRKSFSNELHNIVKTDKKEFSHSGKNE